MAITNLEERVQALEAEVALLKRDRVPETELPWWKQVWGTFKDDEDYTEAMRLGRAYRESLRPEINEEA